MQDVVCLHTVRNKLLYPLERHVNF